MIGLPLDGHFVVVLDLSTFFMFDSRQIVSCCEECDVAGCCPVVLVVRSHFKFTPVTRLICFPLAIGICEVQIMTSMATSPWILLERWDITGANCEREYQDGVVIPINTQTVFTFSAGVIWAIFFRESS